MMKRVPKLRFPEFEGEWEEKKLGEIGEFFKGSTLSKANLSEKGKPCILYGELYTKYGEVIKEVVSKTNLESNKLIIGNKNDVLIPSSGESAIDIATASCLQSDGILLGGDLNVIRAYKDNGVFISYQLNNSKRKEIAKLAQGASVTHLYNNQLNKLKIDIPQKKEQDKIALFFSLIDGKIEKQQKKVGALEKYKKGMMQKIFSQEIRFKDENGEEFPEWEGCILDEILIDNKHPVAKPKNGYERLGLRSHCKGTFHQYIEDENSISVDTLYRVECNNLIVNITFAWEHAIAITTIEDEGKLVSHRFPTYRFVNGISPIFMKYLISRKRFKYDMGVASPGGAGRNRVLNTKLFKQIPIIIPNIKEQEKIGDFLSRLNKKVEIEKQKLEHLKVVKKGLLQQMFL